MAVCYLEQALKLTATCFGPNKDLCTGLQFGTDLQVVPHPWLSERFSALLLKLPQLLRSEASTLQLLHSVPDILQQLQGVAGSLQLLQSKFDFMQQI